MAFIKRSSTWRNVLGCDRYPFEGGRYVLTIAAACPWANRVNIMRKLKKLDEKILKVCFVHPTFQRTRVGFPPEKGSLVPFYLNQPPEGQEPAEDMHCGWAYGKAGEPLHPVGVDGTPYLQQTVVSDNCQEDTFSGHGAKFVRDLYDVSERSVAAAEEKAVASSGPYSVPFLWDTKTNTIVNNESFELVRMLDAWPVVKNGEETNTDKFDFSAQDSLYPVELRKEIDEVIERLYYNINNGVYRCGFARSQEAYDTAAGQIEESMNWLENRLQTSKFLVNNQITLADVQAFPTLIRMDEVYVVYFKCNHVRLERFPAIKKYTARLYQIPEFRETIFLKDIMKHYFTSHARMNTFAIVPKPLGYLEELLKMDVGDDEKS